MKKIICLLVFVLALPGMIQSQILSERMASGDQESDHFRLTSSREVSLRFEYLDSAYFSTVMEQINKAAGLSNTGLAFSIITNVSLLINSSVLSGDLESWQGLVGIVGMGAGITRLVLSFATPKQLRLAEEMLSSPLSEQAWNDYQVENALRHILVARNTSKVIPLLGLTGFAFITGGIFGIGNGNQIGQIAWCIGWGLGVAGLTASIISTNHISKAKKILQAGEGGLSLGIGNSGIGLSYSWH